MISPAAQPRVGRPSAPTGTLTRSLSSGSLRRRPPAVPQATPHRPDAEQSAAVGSTDYPHFDANFPHVAENLLTNVPHPTGAQSLMGAARLYGFTEADFPRADAAAAGTR